MVAFATLTPTNAYAKAAFSDVYDDLLRTRQKSQSQQPQPDRMVVEPEQCYDSQVRLLRLEMESKAEQEGDTSESATDVNTDNDTESEGLGFIWKGHFQFSLDSIVAEPYLGWRIGKHPAADLSICTAAFAKRCGAHLRSFHARFNFSRDNGAFFIAPGTRSMRGGVSVNGEALVDKRAYTLNQHNMKIRLACFEYLFQYTDFASQAQFQEDRRTYLTTSLLVTKDLPFEMPTPRIDMKCIGEWTLGRPLGKGSAGKVFLASNAKNEVVAVKIMEGNAFALGPLKNVVDRYRELTELAKEKNDEGRIVRMRDLIVPGGDSDTRNKSRSYDDVALVMEPMTPKTIRDILESGIAGRERGMSLDGFALFRDILLGVNFLHENGWLHLDLKPDNIGVLSINPARAVLLDVGQAQHIGQAKLKATPGRSGTINYLAPERELRDYGFEVDVWALGVMGFLMTYAQHPFKLSVNPWREGEQYRRLRPTFHQKYDDAIDTLSTHNQQNLNERNTDRHPSYIHIGDLLIQMLQHPWAAKHCHERITIVEALAHPSLEYTTLPIESSEKRPRIQ